MKNLKKLITLLLLSITSLMMLSCGSVETTTNYVLDKDGLAEYEAMEVFKKYAKHDGDATAPKIKEYKDIGLTDVNNTKTLADANKIISEVEVEAIEKPTDIQALLYENGVLLVNNQPLTTPAPVTTTAPPVTTTAPPVTTTAPPVTTTALPVTTTAPPVTTTAPPVTTPPVIKINFEEPMNNVYSDNKVLDFDPQDFTATQDGKDVKNVISIRITHEGKTVTEYDKTQVGKYLFEYIFDGKVIKSFTFTIQVRKVVATPIPVVSPSPTPSPSPTTLVDTEAPVITLKGPSTMTVELGRIYDDPGYIATDNVDGTITSFVKVVGGSGITFRPFSLETFQITYNVTDKAGNKAVEQVRTINVIPDKTAPKFSGKYNISITEGILKTIKLKALDLTSVEYSISGTDADKFTVNSSSGEVSFNEVPEYSKQKRYEFIANASDGQYDSEQKVIINITQKSIIVEEEFTIFSTVSTGDEVGTVNVTGGAVSKFVLENNTDKFSINNKGKMFLKVDASKLVEAPYKVNLHTIDTNGEQSDSATLTINVK